ncbi:hypothetical protein [Terribacillus halophilus]|uniref:hypothetical protein n=1 Tax=Terribacillus halophilus TaxID=361279 RepID=UPI000987554F|nr:hypothetical protein [Terribacillus halophilus]
MEEKRYSPSGTLTLGILAIFIPIIGLITGIIAIIFANKSLQTTEDTEAIKALYLGGRVCAIIGLCYQGLFVLYFIFIIALAISMPSW